MGLEQRVYGVDAEKRKKSTKKGVVERSRRRVEWWERWGVVVDRSDSGEVCPNLSDTRLSYSVILTLSDLESQRSFRHLVEWWFQVVSIYHSPPTYVFLLAKLLWFAFTYSYYVDI